MINIYSLGIEEINKIISAAAFAVREANFLFSNTSNWTDRKGGYFCLAGPGSGLPQLIVPIGNISEEKAEKYLSFCQEKAKRLAQHAEHLSSWESRCPDQNRWGGAVRVGDFIFSMSGFPELGDEAIMLATAGIYYKGWQSPKAIDTINIIAERSQNPYWSNLLAFLSRWI